MFRKLIILGIVMLFSFSLVQGALTDDIVSYWKLADTSDELSTNTLSESGAGISYDSAYGKLGDGADYPVTNVYHNTGITDTGTTFTITGWIYVTSVNQIAISSLKDLHNGEFFMGYIKGTNVIEFSVVDSSAAQYVTSGNNAVTTNNWHFMALVVTGANGEMRAYVDDTNLGNTSLTSYDGTETHDFNLAFTDRSGYGSYDWDSYIDDVGIWSRALTSKEIVELYNEGNGLTYPFSTGDDCDYSGSGDWIISETCYVTDNTKLETGKSIFIQSGATMFIDSGVTIT